MITDLLKRGANPSCTDSDNMTPLHYAAKENYENVCKNLLEHDAMPEARDNDKNLPYTLAFNAGNDEIAAMLVKKMDNKK